MCLELGGYKVSESCSTHTQNMLNLSIYACCLALTSKTHTTKGSSSTVIRPPNNLYTLFTSYLISIYICYFVKKPLHITALTIQTYHTTIIQTPSYFITITLQVKHPSLPLLHTAHPLPLFYCAHTLLHITHYVQTFITCQQPYTQTPACNLLLNLPTSYIYKHLLYHSHIYSNFTLKPDNIHLPIFRIPSSTAATIQIKIILPHTHYKYFNSNHSHPLR